MHTRERSTATWEAPPSEPPPSVYIMEFFRPAGDFSRRAKATSRGIRANYICRACQKSHSCKLHTLLFLRFRLRTIEPCSDGRFNHRTASATCMRSQSNSPQPHVKKDGEGSQNADHVAAWRRAPEAKARRKGPEWRDDMPSLISTRGSVPRSFRSPEPVSGTQGPLQNSAAAAAA